MWHKFNYGLFEVRNRGLVTYWLRSCKKCFDSVGFEMAHWTDKHRNETNVASSLRRRCVASGSGSHGSHFNFFLASALCGKWTTSFPDNYSQVEKPFDSLSYAQINNFPQVQLRKLSWVLKILWQELRIKGDCTDWRYSDHFSLLKTKCSHLRCLRCLE